MKSSGPAPTARCMRATKDKERQITRSGADGLAYQIQMLLVVSAPKAFQRKLVEGADKGTTRQVKTSFTPAMQPSFSYASRADPTRRGRWRKVGGRREAALLPRYRFSFNGCRIGDQD